MSSSTSRKVLLKSSDEALFEVEEAVALQSQTLKNLVEDTAPDSDAEIPLKNVRGCILAKIIEHCKKLVEGSDNVNLDALRTWDLEFVKVDLNILFDLMMAANFLDIRDLSDLTFQAAADMIKGKTPEEIRTIFNIKNDFTEDEENQIRKENQWAFE